MYVKLPQDIGKPAFGRAFGHDLARQERLGALADHPGLVLQRHLVERHMLAARLHPETLELGGKVLLDGLAHLRHPGLHRLLVAVG